MAKILFATTAEGVKFYPVTITDAVVHIKGNTQTKLSELIDDIDYTGKADKVNNAISGNLAKLDATGNLVDSGKKTTDFATSAQGTKADSAIQGIKVGGTAVSPDANKVVNITVATGDGNGQIKIAAKNVSVKGLGSAAYAESSDFDTAGAAATAEQNAKDYADTLASNYDASGTAQSLINSLDSSKTQAAGNDGLSLSITEVDGKITAISGSIASGTYDEAGAAAAVLGNTSDGASSYTVHGSRAYTDAATVSLIGTTSDAASANTVNGAKNYADEAVSTALQGLTGALIYKGTVDATHTLPSTGMKKGEVYVVAANGTYASKACEIGDYLIYNGTSWDAINGENQVSNKNASLSIGTAVTIATVDGTDVKVTQVEDMTKIEAVAVSDTTEYADVTTLFTAS